eukprot:gene15321-biopygen14255
MLFFRVRWPTPATAPPTAVTEAPTMSTGAPTKVTETPTEATTRPAGLHPGLVMVWVGVCHWLVTGGVDPPAWGCLLPGRVLTVPGHPSSEKCGFAQQTTQHCASSSSLESAVMAERDFCSGCVGSRKVVGSCQVMSCRVVGSGWFGSVRF